MEVGSSRHCIATRRFNHKTLYLNSDPLARDKYADTNFKSYVATSIGVYSSISKQPLSLLYCSIEKGIIEGHLKHAQPVYDRQPKVIVIVFAVYLLR
jgi:hypothetical protein